MELRAYSAKPDRIRVSSGHHSTIRVVDLHDEESAMRTLPSERCEEHVKLRIHCDLDELSIPKLMSVLDELLIETLERFEIDLCKCLYMSARALGIIICIAKRCRNFKVWIASYGCVFRIFDVSGFTSPGSFVGIRPVNVATTALQVL